jgi:hypothetical protein
VSRRASLWVLALAGVASTGCTYAPSIHAPRYARARELVLTYDEGYVLSAGGRPVAKGHGFEGLASFVGCVPGARANAEAAEANGAAVVPLQAVGATLGVGGLGGLSGIAFLGKNGSTAAGLLLGGLGVQLLGLVLVAAGAQAKVNANGHAVDAMNYYNDAAGSRGLGCAPAGGMAVK